jgi:hypothetical protein
MFKSKIIFFTLLLSLFYLNFTFYGFSQSKKQQTIDLPEKVINAFKSAYPAAIIKKSSIEIKKGMEIYKIESSEKKIKRDLFYSNEGIIIEIRESLSIPNIPENITDALAEGYEGCEIKKAEKVTIGEAIEYDLIIKCGTDKFSVNIDKSGNIIKNEKVK